MAMDPTKPEHESSFDGIVQGGNALVTELATISNMVTLKGTQKELLNRENKIILEILRERARIGVLPQGISIYPIMYDMGKKLSEAAPELSENGCRQLPLIQYSVRDGTSNYLSAVQLLNIMLDETDFTIPLSDALREVDSLLQGLPVIEKDVFPTSLKPIISSSQAAVQLEGISAVYFAKRNGGRLDRNIANESIHDIREAVAESTSQTIAVLRAYEMPYTYHVIGLGYHTTSEESNFDFHVYLPRIKDHRQVGYDRLNLHIPTHRTDLIDFLLRIEEKGWTREKLSRRGRLTSSSEKPI